MPSQTEECRVARETVPEAGTMACCYTWRWMKRMLGLIHTTPHFAAFGAASQPGYTFKLGIRSLS